MGRRPPGPGGCGGGRTDTREGGGGAKAAGPGGGGVGAAGKQPPGVRGREGGGVAARLLGSPMPAQRCEGAGGCRAEPRGEGLAEAAPPRAGPRQLLWERATGPGTAEPGLRGAHLPLHPAAVRGLSECLISGAWAGRLRGCICPRGVSGSSVPTRAGRLAEPGCAGHSACPAPAAAEQL